MDLNEKLAEYGRLLHKSGSIIGAGGNISAKSGDIMVIKRACIDMSKASADDYIAVSLTDRSSDKDIALSSETPFHVACYRTRPDIGSVFHTHSPETIAVGAKTDLLPVISYEFEVIMGTAVPVIGPLPPGSGELAEALAEIFSKDFNGVIIKGHGPVCVGKDIEESFLRSLALDRACWSYLHM